MSVTFVGASAVADSGGLSVTTKNVDRSALSLNVGDYCLVWGWVNTSVDWTMNPGADGVPWTKLWKYDRFQVWGKKLGSGFSTSVTVVDFSGGRVVFGLQQAFWRGVSSQSWHGAVTGTGRNSVQAPSAFPTGIGGKVGRLFSFALDAAVTPTMSTPGGYTNRAGHSVGGPDFSWTLCDKTYVGSGSVGTATTNINNGLTASERTYQFASALTVIFNENQPPTAPTLISPSDGAVLNAAVEQDYEFQHNDPDGDPQSGYSIRLRKIDTGDPWVVATFSSTAAQRGIFTGTTHLTDDHDYEWQVQTTDNHGATGPWSSSRFFSTAEIPDVPVIDYPANNGTVTRVDHLDWTFTDQEDYEVRRVADDIDGNPDTGTIYEDDTSSDSTDATDTRTRTFTFATNGRYEHLQVRCKLSGIWSDWADVRVFVSYVAPPTADLQVFEGDDGASMNLVYATAAPDGSIPDQPAATSVELDYTTDGGVTAVPFVQGLPVSGAYVYDRPCSGVDYCFRAVTFADNGTASVGDWISRGRFTIDQVE